MIELKSFATGLPEIVKYGDGKEMESAICKQPVEEAYLATLGFRGDRVADLRHHGGPNRAVCVYPYEHYAAWEEEIQGPLPDATFGENLTVSNLLEQDAYIGDIYRLGDAVIQITQGRIPCSTITKRTNTSLLLKRMVETGFTGYLCRVLEEGIVRRDSKMTLIEAHPKQVSILFANEVYFRRPKDIEAIKKVLDVPELADEWRESLTKRLEKLLKKI